MEYWAVSFDKQWTVFVYTICYQNIYLGMMDVAQTNDQHKATSIGRSSSRRNMLIIDEESPAVQKSGCCG